MGPTEHRRKVSNDDGAFAPGALGTCWARARFGSDLCHCFWRVENVAAFMVLVQRNIVRPCLAKSCEIEKAEMIFFET